MRVPWLADVLRGAGLQVQEMEGWQGRGRPLTTVNGIVLHHTATSQASTDSNVARILRDGRADLPGPLAQLGLDRGGRFWVVADGRCNHNGHGKWGNQAIGVEAFNDGTHEPWGERQLVAWQRGCAAILRHLGMTTANVLGHRETDPGRKIDPHGVDLAWFRGIVARLLDEGNPFMALSDDEQRELLDGVRFLRVQLTHPDNVPPDQRHRLSDVLRWVLNDLKAIKAKM